MCGGCILLPHILFIFQGKDKISRTLPFVSEGKAEILNENFSSIGKRLAKDPPALNNDNVHTYITRVSPMVMSCEITIKY